MAAGRQVGSTGQQLRTHIWTAMRQRLRTLRALETEKHQQRHTSNKATLVGPKQLHQREDIKHSNECAYGAVLTQTTTLCQQLYL